ncbi:hypothetical protein DFH08DRAFT_804625 [Mycena albidolilacea]|uniref:Uncharacterized protein n=1 Tax=Mycena albidolilacea TaxID=1033008 RepID=A0AAD7A9R5_9AGAR|nr:hypothetical protein DFH08DRAFT_804625 [Mycena albidolilacea]
MNSEKAKQVDGTDSPYPSLCHPYATRIFCRNFRATGIGDSAGIENVGVDEAWKEDAAAAKPFKLRMTMNELERTMEESQTSGKWKYKGDTEDPEWGLDMVKRPSFRVFPIAKGNRDYSSINCGGRLIGARLLDRYCDWCYLKINRGIKVGLNLEIAAQELGPGFNRSCFICWS